MPKAKEGRVMPYRERVVRTIALKRGVSMTAVAEELGMLVGTLYATFQSRRPRNTTVGRIYQWSRDHSSALKGAGLLPVTEEKLTQ